MNSTLHITNGDSAVDLLQAGGMHGTFLPWRDVLHMGPVRTALPLAELSAQRAEFITSLGWGDADAAARDFAERDRLLINNGDFDQVILWFEHDLYDQLQLLQILHWFYANPRAPKNLWLINPGKHLCHHTPEQVPDLLADKQPVSAEQLALAHKAWLAFGQSSPETWNELLNIDTSALPFLRQAILRGLQELPSVKSGVTLTEQMILAIIDEGFHHKGPIFRTYCSREPDAFHGDSGFFWYLQQLIDDKPPLIQQQGEEFHLTETGENVLAGILLWQRQYHQPQWLGGYCLSAQVANRWYWDNEEQSLKRN